jgi:hypothetical protein
MNNDQYVYYINSYTDRKPSDYTHQWTTFFNDPVRISGRKRMKIQLQDVEVPNTAYTFPDSSSILWVNVWDGISAWVLYHYIIETDRFFQAGADVVASLNALCAAESLVFSYSPTTCRLTLTNNNAQKIRIVGSYRYSDSLTTTYNNIIDRLGYTQDLTVAEVNSGGTIEGECILNLLRTNRYYITCSNIGGFNKQSRVPTPYANPYILASVPSSNFGRMSQLSYGSTVFLTCNQTELKSMDFTILDDELNVCPLNECKVTFTLLIEVEPF